MNKNNLTIVAAWLFLATIAIAIIYFIYKKMTNIAKTAKDALTAPFGIIESAATDIWDKGSEAIEEISKPFESEEEKQIFYEEAKKNLLDPREWYENLSYWWS